MAFVSRPTWKKLNKLSEKQLLQLVKLMGVGFLNDDNDRDELVLMLSVAESESKVKAALQELKRDRPSKSSMVGEKQ